TFNPSIASGMVDISVENDGKILLMGGFTTVNGIARQGFARLNANGSLDSSFTANLGWDVPNVANASGVLEQPDGKLIVSAGTFRSVNGVDRWGCARV